MHDIDFLSGRVVVYYAGADNESLYGGRGDQHVKEWALRQIAFLKAITLVCDHIIIPPSHYFFLVYCLRDKVALEELVQLLRANIVLSPIYRGMNSGVDFLEYKRETGRRQEREIVDVSQPLIYRLFHEMPVFHRDVEQQSTRFRAQILLGLDRLSIGSSAEAAVRKYIEDQQGSNAILSRASMHVHVESLRSKGAISRGDFRKIYYLSNREYYSQGAALFGGHIVLSDTSKYSVLGAELYRDQAGILVGLDPLLLVSILERLGISPELLAALPVEQLVAIKDHESVREFRDWYLQIARELQRLQLEGGRVTADRLKAVQAECESRLGERYWSEAKTRERWAKRYDIAETIVLGAASSGVGLLAAGLIGAVMIGVGVPLAFKVSGASKRADKAVVEVLGRGRFKLQQLVEELREATDKLKEPE